jgi:DEAD/DEAH box helicase domain-containing protein
VFVKAIKARYYTRALSEKETEILAVERSRPVANFLARLGRIRVTEQVVGYEKRNLYSGELLDNLSLELPPQSFETVGLWLEIEDILQEMILRRGLHFMGGIHALEHALISMFPLFALCDRNEAARGFEMIEELLVKTGELIGRCPCDSGCPSCIHSPKCGAGNKPLDKTAASLLVKGLLGEVPLKVKSSKQGEDFVVELEEDAGKDNGSDPAVGVFDIETQRLADEVGGWGNVHLMRLAVAVLYDSRSDIYEAFTEEQVESLIERLQNFDLVVGFNIKRFDYRVLGAYTALDFRTLPTFDILEDIHRRLGFRLSLGHLAEQTLGKAKIADGIQAVRWLMR